MAARREVWPPPSVAEVWCDDLVSFGEEMDHEWLSWWPSGRISEREGNPRSWREVAGRTSCGLNIDNLPGTRVWDEVIREVTTDHDDGWTICFMANTSVERSRNLCSRRREDLLSAVLGLWLS